MPSPPPTTARTGPPPRRRMTSKDAGNDGDWGDPKFWYPPCFQHSAWRLALGFPPKESSFLTSRKSSAPLAKKKPAKKHLQQQKMVHWNHWFSSYRKASNANPNFTQPSPEIPTPPLHRVHASFNILNPGLLPESPSSMLKMCSCTCICTIGFGVDGPGWLAFFVGWFTCSLEKVTR